MLEKVMNRHDTGRYEIIHVVANVKPLTNPNDDGRNCKYLYIWFIFGGLLA